jgi:hypothetical protein
MEDATAPFLSASAEYLLWAVRGAPLHQPLATTDRFNNPQGASTNPSNPTGGGLADPNTIVVLGNQTIGYGALSGARFSAGYLLCDQMTFEGSGFFLGRGSKTETVESDRFGNPFLFRPYDRIDYVNPNAGVVVALPNFYTGGVSVTQSTDLWGAEANLVVNWNGDGPYSIQWIAGFRTLQLKEELDIDSRTTIVDTTGLASLSFDNIVLDKPGDGLAILDRFGTRNHFYGGQVGARWNAFWGRWGVGAATKIAVGGTDEQVLVEGQTVALPAAGGSTTVPGGLLAVPSNSGKFASTRFSVLPELRLDASYIVSSHVRVVAGYDFLYLSDVVRPGDQVNLQITGAGQIPTAPVFLSPPVGPAAPLGPTFRHTDFWAQGFHFSLEFCY